MVLGRVDRCLEIFTAQAAQTGVAHLAGLGGLPRLCDVVLLVQSVNVLRERKSSAASDSRRSVSKGLTGSAETVSYGPSYDLPVAVGILAASGQIVGSFDDAVFMGELSLDGEVRSVHGVLPMVDLARKNGKQRAFVPAANAAEASLVSGVEVFPVTTLASLASHLLGAVPIEPHAGAPAETQAELLTRPAARADNPRQCSPASTAVH